MSQKLSQGQAILLGLVVVFVVGLSGFGLVRIAAKQGLWAETFEVTVGFAEVHDVSAGTPVRIRGVDAGQVIAVEYPDHDGPDAAVMLRLKVNAKYADRLYADASANLHSTGLLGGKVVAVNPGTPQSGPLQNGRLKAGTSPDLAQAAAKIGDVADEAKLLLQEVRSSTGTLNKLVKDDELYNDLKGLAKDSRREVNNVQNFVNDGRDTMRSVRQGTDALSKMPLIRSYVEDATTLLVRPTARREGFTYNTIDIFEPGTAILNDNGRWHLQHVVQWLGEIKNDKADLVVVALCDPNDKTQTTASAAELTRKQAETIVEFLKAQGVHKIGWVTRRKMTAIGLGIGPTPVIEKDPVPPSYIQVLLFLPQ